MSESRCNNTLMFMLCFRSTGSSFSLSDSVAMNVHAAFKKEQQTQLAVIENYVRKSKLLKSKTKATTFSPIPDQTELDTNVAANFWNAFRGKPRLITEGCGPLLR
ncbi:Hypothetical protein NTJ_14542 [Nesidiocoris tenuis]|uniref:Uncharacterized protein n=1 Tax=Nesidiocoris tenuis TaxID=355587 RepID=A0ABN7BBG8_9HEMI|nr:Hypothetical protein NTJ_14542 [Nesidiocoris tenuis]